MLLFLDGCEPESQREAARQLLRRATRASDEAEQQLLTDFDEAEAEQLRHLLGRIAPRRVAAD